ncbi:ABC transporter permease [Pseudokineococcus basanitobsidens]|uniref:ABC transporter permease n=1 Tax=Pseudokineococcus basanitobsidens TaxID=1926649 RepID=A0ABU8RH72_9ACTN
MSAATTTATAGTGTRRGRTAGRFAEVAQRRGSVVVLVLVVVVASVVFDDFASLRNAENIAVQSSFLAVIALGMTFVIITGGIDLSVGSVFALGGVVTAWASQYGTLAALGVPLALCGGIGLVNGLLVTRVRMAPFIVTLASLLFARGLLLALSDGGQTTYLVPDGTALTVLGRGSVLGLPWPVVVVVGLYALGALVLQRTGYGQTVLAVGGGEDASRLMGLAVDRTKLLAYTSSGLLAGFAGTMSTARSGAGVTIVGVGLELTAISAVVIGGTLLTGGAGSTGGTLAGVVLLGVIANIINQVGSLDSSYQLVVNGAFLVAVVVVQTLLARRQSP